MATAAKRTPSRPVKKTAPKKRAPAKARKPKPADEAPPVEQWEQQPGESPPAFEAFARYRDMGVNRNIRAVAQQLSKSGALIGGWSSKHKWVARAEAYDREQDRQTRIEMEQDRKSMAVRHAQIAKVMQSKIVDRLSRITPDEIDKMSTRDMANWLEVSVRIERQARGEPDRHSVEHSGPGGGPIQLENVTDDELLNELALIHGELSARTQDEKDAEEARAEVQRLEEALAAPAADR